MYILNILTCSVFVLLKCRKSHWGVVAFLSVREKCNVTTKRSSWYASIREALCNSANSLFLLSAEDIWWTLNWVWANSVFSFKFQLLFPPTLTLVGPHLKYGVKFLLPLPWVQKSCASTGEGQIDGVRMVGAYNTWPVGGDRHPMACLATCKLRDNAIAAYNYLVTKMMEHNSSQQCQVIIKGQWQWTTSSGGSGWAWGGKEITVGR